MLINYVKYDIINKQPKNGDFEGGEISPKERGRNMAIERELREVAKEEIRKVVRDEGNVEIMLKHNTPNRVPAKYLSWYREILKDEWKRYKAGKSETNEETRGGAKLTTKQVTKKSTRQTGRFRR